MIIVSMMHAHLLVQSRTNSQRWLVALATFALAALAAASVTFWVLHWPTPGAPLTAATVSAPDAVVDGAKLAQLLGASANARDAAGTDAPAPGRYKLLGVIAQGRATNQGTRGSALIAVDNAPAKPYRVGDTVADALVLRSVQQRRVVLAPASGTGADITLDLPLPAGMPARP